MKPLLRLLPLANGVLAALVGSRVLSAVYMASNPASLVDGSLLFAAFLGVPFITVLAAISIAAPKVRRIWAAFLTEILFVVCVCVFTSARTWSDAGWVTGSMLLMGSVITLATLRLDGFTLMVSGSTILAGFFLVGSLTILPLKSLGEYPLTLLAVPTVAVLSMASIAAGIILARGQQVALTSRL